MACVFPVAHLRLCRRQPNENLGGKMSFLYWGLLLASTAFLSALIILRERDVKWLLYGLAGSVIAGLFFDPLSVHFGYYKFNLPFGSIWGVPFLVILQEALCVI